MNSSSTNNPSTNTPPNNAPPSHYPMDGSSNNLVKFHLLFLNGKEKGRQLKYLKERVTIGRAPENDVVIISDPKVSRNHIEFISINNQLLVRNISETSSLIVNGLEATEMLIPFPCFIQIGNTELKVTPFTTVSSALAMEGNHAPHSEINGHPAHASGFSVLPKINTPFSVDKMNKTSKFYFFIAGVLLLGLFVFWGESKKNKKLIEQVRTTAQVRLDVLKSETEVERLQKEKEKSGRNSIQWEKAQEHYKKGFRDYRNGQFSRAIGSFQAALSFYPDHVLARKYYDLSKRKNDELIEYQIILGKRYLEKNHFRLCSATYKKVMEMVKDSSDPKYIESKQYYNECELRKAGD